MLTCHMFSYFRMVWCWVVVGGVYRSSQVGVHFGLVAIIVGSFWDQSGITLESLCDHVWGSLWGHFGITLGSLWGHFGLATIAFMSHWVHFGLTMGSLIISVAILAQAFFGM